MIREVKLTKGQKVTKQQIQNALNDARGTFQYAKFTMWNGIFIAVTYNKDLTILVTTNSRDLALYVEMQSLMRTYTQMRVVEFMFRWISKLNK